MKTKEYLPDIRLPKSNLDLEMKKKIQEKRNEILKFFEREFKCLENAGKISAEDLRIVVY